MITLFFGAANMVLLTTLWMLYHSIVAIGQNWYGFGWESQVLETGFLAIWFVPLFSCSKWENKPGLLPVLGNKWMIFRIMIGAGLIKIRGDQCWRDFTCMNYHYETQPVPNPMSYFMHQAPEDIHKLEVVGNHIVELIMPIFILFPWRTPRMISAGSIIFMMGIIIVSGNLAFLNHLTMIPAICAFDDKFFAPVFCSCDKIKAIISEKTVKTGRIRKSINFCISCLILKLSFPVVINLLSRKQMMNQSFDPLRIVNTYGTFGSITKERTELILKFSEVENPTKKDWVEIEFKCKPGKIDSRPCLISPYHYRLDWLMWFAAFQQPRQNQWLFPLVKKLLENDRKTIQLLKDGEMERKNSKWIKIDHYLYKFETNGKNWWTRKKLREYIQPMNLEMLTNMGV